MRCDQCRFWEEDTPANSINRDWQANSIGFRACLAIKARWNITDSITGDPAIENLKERVADASRRSNAALIAARAYVQDGSEYRAEILTSPDFYCALFQDKN